MPDWADDDLMAEVLRLAGERSHRLQPWMTDGRRLTRPQAQMARDHMRSRPVIRDCDGGCGVSEPHGSHVYQDPAMTGVMLKASDLSAADRRDPLVMRRPPDDPSHEADVQAVMAPAPRSPRPVSFFTMIPDGWYAVPSRTGNNDLDFFHVKTKSARSARAGQRFVDRVIGGHEDQLLGNVQGRLALEAILEAGPEAAAKKYADETEQCSHCPAHLTDDASRALGMGEQCATNHGMGEEWRRLDRELRPRG
jgi:hypothetical protein